MKALRNLAAAFFFCAMALSSQLPLQAYYCDGSDAVLEQPCTGGTSSTCTIACQNYAQSQCDDACEGCGRSYSGDWEHPELFPIFGDCGFDNAMGTYVGLVVCQCDPIP